MAELTREEIVLGFIETREAQISEGVSLESKEILLSEIASFKQELADIEAAKQEQAEQEMAQQVRIQAHEENKEGLLQFIQEMDLFETFFPKEKYAEVMGLSEYIDKQQSFNQVLHQALVAVEEKRKERHDEELSERDEKIVALRSAIKQNGEDYERQLKHLSELYENEVKTSSELNRQIEILQEEIKELNACAEETEDRKNELEKELVKAQEQIEKLTNQIEATKQTDAPKITSSLKDLLSQAKIKSAAEIALERLDAPFRGKVTIGDNFEAPPLALEVTQFRPEHFQTNDTTVQLDQAEPSTSATDNPEVTFREEVQMADSASSGEGQSLEKVTREEFEALKADVEVLKRRNGMVA